MSSDERSLLERYAGREGLALGYWIRRTALERALEQLALDMIQKDRQQVVDNLIAANPFVASEFPKKS